MRNMTYIAGDWTGDRNLINAITSWNEGDKWTLSFSDAHSITQSSDDSLPCSIKSSLRKRLDLSKTFVLIVGDSTKNLTKGSCYHCRSYSNYHHHCTRGHSPSSKSFIEYECNIAVRDGLRIVVIYNSLHIDRDKCPDMLRWEGEHLEAIYLDLNGKPQWRTNAIIRAIEGW